MQRILSILMMSLTICAVAGLFWLQNTLSENKQEYGNHLMIRHGQQFDVKAGFDWETMQFAGSFEDEKGESYRVEKYKDGTFYDDYLVRTWVSDYADMLEEELEEKDISVKRVEIHVPKSVDTLLFGDDVIWNGNVDLKTALEEGLEKKMVVTVSLNDSIEEEKLTNMLEGKYKDIKIVTEKKEPIQ